MPSMDDRKVKIVDAANETSLTLIVFPTGEVKLGSHQTKEWVVATLREIADDIEKKGGE